MKAPRLFYGWWLAITGALVSALVGGSVFYGLGAFFAPIQVEYQWSFSIVSLAFALQLVVMGLCGVGFGWLFDHLSPRLLAFGGVAIAGTSFAALGAVRSTAELYVVFAVMGIGALITTFLLFNSLIALWFHHSLGLALAVLQTGYGVGGLTALGFVVLIQTLSWRWAAVVIGATILLVGLPLSAHVRKPAPTSDMIGNGPPPFRQQASEGPQSPIDIQNERNGPRIRAVLVAPRFWAILIVIAFSSAITQAVFAHQIRALLTYGLAQTVAGGAAGWTGVVGLAGRYGFGWMADSLSSRKLLAAALTLQGAGALALSQAGKDVDLALVAFVVLFGIGQGGIFLLSPVIQRDYFGTRDFGAVQGAILGPSMCLSALGPIAAGASVDAYGSYRPGFFIAGLSAMFLALLILLIGRGAYDRQL